MNRLFRHTSQCLDDLYKFIEILNDPQNNRSILNDLLIYSNKVKSERKMTFDEQERLAQHIVDALDGEGIDLLDREN